MLKKILSSRCASIFLDALGVFSLASYIALGSYLRFIVNLIPSCYITDALIVYVECGNGFWPEILKFYFLFYSPFLIIAGGLFIAIMGIFKSFYSTIVSGFFILSVFCAIRVTKKLIERMESSCKVRKDYLYIFMLAGLIFTPGLIVATTYSIVKPNPSSNRIIEIDMWHNVFSMPRNNLYQWSLVDIERPAEEPSPFINWFQGRGIMKYPYASMNVSYNEIDPSLNDDEMVQIVIAPHYKVMSKDELYKQRDKIVSGILAQQYRGEPIYKSAGRITNWELYESFKYPNINPDLLIHRNPEGQIENILKCTPKTHCSERVSYNRTKTKECKTPEECLPCTKICSDESLGSASLSIHYEFDKKNLNSYFERHKDILDFIDAHTVPKESDISNIME